ncbi:MAG: capsule assembly Wzi family protein [Candidatus Omnitrophota bacterium]
MVSFIDKGAGLKFSRLLPIGGLVMVGLLSSCVGAWASPVDVPLDHWSYGAVERLAAAGLCDGLGFGMRPLTRDWMAEKVLEALKRVEKGEIEFSPEAASQIEEDLLRLSSEFAPELKQLGYRGAETERNRLPGQPFQWKQFLFYTGFSSEKLFTDFKRETSSSLIENSQGFRIQDGLNGRWSLPSWVSMEDWLAVSLTPSIRFRDRDSDTDADVEEASVKLAYRNFEIKGGELNFWWGPGAHGEFFLTNNARPLRGFSLRTRRAFRLPWKLERLGNWQMQVMSAQLEEERTIPESLLTGMRIEWSPLARLILGASHTSLTMGKDEKKEISDFLGALDPTQGGGAEERADHLFGGDIRFFLPEAAQWSRIGTGLELYGEFFGEDTSGFYYPELVSYLGGFFVADLFSLTGLDFRFEGVTTDPAAYEHYLYTSGYRYKSEFLGHHVGPDADDLFFRLAQTFFVQEKRLVLGVQFDRERRGKSGAPLSFGDVALTKNEVQIDLAYEWSKRVDVAVAYQFEDVNNSSGSSGADSQNHIVAFETQFRF